ncbi:MAG TPA: hypothetical protein PLN48_05820 [Lachnospiraceae bacterium]|nr:hypothetical protein [Lachnospiraceae bacterium]
MFFVKLLLKIVLFPVMLTVMLIEWIGVFLTSFGGAILYILSGIVFLITLAAWIVLHEPLTEVIKYMGLSFGVFLVSVIADWLVEKIGCLSSVMKRFMVS